MRDFITNILNFDLVRNYEIISSNIHRGVLHSDQNKRHPLLTAVLQ